MADEIKGPVVAGNKASSLKHEVVVEAGDTELLGMSCCLSAYHLHCTDRDSDAGIQAGTAAPLLYHPDFRGGV